MNDLAHHYALLLGLREDWLVQSVDLDLEGLRVVIGVRHNPESPCTCPECGEVRPLKDHGDERSWRHLDTMQFETVIVGRVPRTNCPDCGVRTIHIPWASPHGRFTLLFEAFAIRVLQASSSIEKGRQLLGLGWNAVQKIMDGAVQRGVHRRDLDEIRHVGIDEKNFGKGHDYVSVMTDIDGGRVLDVAPGRTQEAADSLWKTLSEEQKHQVEAVAMDMWAAFINSAERHVPQADIVHDRFHIAKHLGEAVDQVRRAEHKALKQEGDERLTGSRYLWLTNEENLSEEKAATFEDLKEADLKTSRAWAMRELFRDFFEQRTAAKGRAFFKQWYAWASRCRLTPMVKVAKMIKRHFERIVTWFSHRISNASAEGFNSLIVAVQGPAHTGQSTQTACP
ncbi:MAG: ISL3 family transposase [Planctomycetota bacterium]|nr:ISL3 family transposase [Planctomycetota bacterium]